MRLDDDVQNLLAPVMPWIRRGVENLGADTLQSISLAPMEGFCALDEADLSLSSALAGPGVFHPLDEARQSGIDRWRRAAMCVIEGAAAVGLPEAYPAWLRAGLAAFWADRAVPELGIAADARAEVAWGDLHARPRAGLGVVEAWAAVHDDLRAFVKAQVARGIGASDLLEVFVEPKRASLLPSVGLPCEVGPWRVVRLHARGNGEAGPLSFEGDVAGSQAWFVPGQTDVLVVSGPVGGAVRIGEAAPLGSWSLTSVGAFGRVMGARGIVLTLRARGRAELVLADAFVGGVEDLALANRVGTSGVVPVRWHAAGVSAFELTDLRIDQLTVHGRDTSGPLAMPLGESGLANGLRLLADTAWTWQIHDDGRLEFTGEFRQDPLAHAPASLFWEKVAP